MTDLPAIISRVRNNAVVVCDKCKLHGINNDVVVCRGPGNCHDLADHSRAAVQLADECERLRAQVAELEAERAAMKDGAKLKGGG